MSSSPVTAAEGRAAALTDRGHSKRNQGPAKAPCGRVAATGDLLQTTCVRRSRAHQSGRQKGAQRAEGAPRRTTSYFAPVLSQKPAALIGVFKGFFYVHDVFDC